MSNTKPQLSVEIEEQLRIKMAEELHIDWAFKDVHGKPDTIIITGTPKGSYETDYNLFVENMAHFLATALEEQKREIIKIFLERVLLDTRIKGEDFKILVQIAEPFFKKKETE